MKFSSLVTGATVSFGFAVATYAADFRITESYGGLNGNPKGTRDWVEITNFGAPGSLSGLWVTPGDSNGDPDPLEASPLPTATLGTGESIIVILGVTKEDRTGNPPGANAVEQFHNLWGSGINVLTVDAAYDEVTNLAAAGGDAVYIGNGDGSTFFSAIAGYEFNTRTNSPVFWPNNSTVEALGGSIVGPSTEGVNGAWKAEFNGGASFLVGSPGYAPIPEPTTAGLIVLGAVGLWRRRRPV